MIGPTPDEQRVLDLANELGYWPSYRQTKDHLGIDSNAVAGIRNAAEAYWRGSDTPTASLRRGSGVPIVIGVTAEQQADPSEMARVWAAAIAHCDCEAERARQRKNQRIVFPPEPFALALLGDTHVGDSGVDYRALRRDAEIIRDTPGMSAIFGGDSTNNWIIGKLQALQRNELLSHDTAWSLFLDWFDMIGSKWVAVIAGNHNAWTSKVAGFDPLARHLQNALCLYDPDEIVFALECGDFRQRWKVRHKWRGSSIFNPTHGQEVGWERGDDDYDVAVGFHTHNGTLFREFMKHGRRRYAVQMGAYKLRDRYGVEIGFASTPGVGCGAVVGAPDGRFSWHRDLGEAASYLEFLRSRYVLE